MIRRDTINMYFDNTQLNATTGENTQDVQVPDLEMLYLLWDS